MHSFLFHYILKYAQIATTTNGSLLARPYGGQANNHAQMRPSYYGTIA